MAAASSRSGAMSKAKGCLRDSLRTAIGRRKGGSAAARGPGTGDRLDIGYLAGGCGGMFPPQS